MFREYTIAINYGITFYSITQMELERLSFLSVIVAV